MIKLNSSWIEGVNVLDARKIEVVFKDGGKEILTNFSTEKLVEFVRSPSAGRFYNFAVKNNTRHRERV